MEQKKTMNLWQMIALVVLLAGVTISMFFPVLNPTGQKMVSSFEKFANRYEEDENIGKSCKIWNTVARTTNGMLLPLYS